MNTPTRQTPPSQSTGRNEVIFVDPRVDDYQTLLNGVADDTVVILLDPSANGVEQIAQALAQRGEFDAIHLVSHGSEGRIALGNSTLDSETLPSYARFLEQWGEALGPNGDILIYGCDVGAGEQGLRFVESLAQVTGADVAASDDLTGASDLGGDWDLEQQTGLIETAVFSPAPGLFQSTLAISNENFDDVGLINEKPVTSINVGDWTFAMDGADRIATPSPSDFTVNLNNSGDPNDRVIWMNFENPDIRQFTFSSTDGSEFDLASAAIGISETTTDTNPVATIQGFRDGAAVTSAESLDFTASDTQGDAHYTYNETTAGGAYGAIDFQSGYDNVDEVRITFSDVAVLEMDDLVASPAVTNNNPVFENTDPGGLVVDETSTDTTSVIHDVNANDGDSSGTDSVTYSITAGNVDGAFEIDSNNGEIRLADPDALDYEATASYTLTIQADDGESSNNTATQDITISVNDIAPAITTGQVFSVKESDDNSTVLGTVATTGDDNSVSYSIESGNTGNAFTIDGATGEITLSDTSQLDASATGSYTLSVQATDGNTASTQDVTINVTDDVAPSVTSIAPSGSPDANAASVDYTVTFSESVSNVSADDFTLTSTGTASGTISAVAGSGDSYTVSVTGISGEGDLRLDLNSGTDIDDGATNAPAGYTSGTAHSVDLVKPSVTNVTSPTADGTYKAGDTVDITLTFSEVVTVTGTPQLTLETGATDRVIDYTAGSGTNTLTFAYTVQAGDETSDLALAGSEILLSGGTLQDAEGNNAVVTLPTPGDANSLSANKDIVIDAVVPSVTSIAPSGSPAANAASVEYTVTFSEDVNDVSIDDFLLNTTGSASGNIASISGSGSSYTVTVDTITG
ncbi:DUF4347 domain-containing protein, partial [Vreelandella titanicae]